MAKKNVKKFLEEKISEAWASQAKFHADSEEYALLNSNIAAWQEVYVFLTGDELEPSASDTADDEEAVDEEPAAKEDDDEEEEDEEEEDDEDDEK